MGGTGRPLGKTFFLQCQRRHPEPPKIPTYLPTLAKEIQEIKRNWVPESDDKSKENKENDKNKDKDKKGKKGGKKKGVNEVDAEESTPTTTTDAP